MRWVVTGANRGIGLELVRQALARGDEVEATARRPEEAEALNALSAASDGRLRIHALDVRDDASVSAFAEAIERPIDALINNAGVSGQKGALESLSMEKALAVFDTNALGALRVTRALLPRLREGAGKKVAHLSSLMGSVADNRGGSSYAYRMSKTALNMAARSLAVDLRGEGIISVPLHPGWVQTDMGGTRAPTKVEDSAAGLLRLIDGLTLEHSGRFFDFTGKELPW